MPWPSEPYVTIDGHHLVTDERAAQAILILAAELERLRVILSAKGEGD